LLSEKKKGKKKDELKPIPKGDVSLNMYHLDHLGPITSMSKLYKYLLVIVDRFSKFVWLYLTKTTNIKKVIDKLTAMQQISDNPRRVITDRGAAFTSSDFCNFCTIEQIAVTTDVPRGNGQIRTCKSDDHSGELTKLSLDNPDRRYRHVAKLQMSLNNTYQRNVGMSPFEALFGVKKYHDDVQIFIFISLLKQ